MSRLLAISGPNRLTENREEKVERELRRWRPILYLLLFIF
jgi:hypothetical protein